MNDESYNGQTITQYLLGFLSEKDAEHLDELSIVDDEFAEALRAAENDLVDAYAHGELNAAESERFTSHYLASPLRREKATFAEEFQRSSQMSAIDQAAPGKQERRSVQRKKAGLFSSLGVFSGSRLAWQWGFAVVAIVLVIVGGLLVFQNVRLRQEMAQTQARHDEFLQREQQLQQEIAAQRLTNSKTEQELARLRDERERLEGELKVAQLGAKPPASTEGSILAVVLAPPLRGGGQLPTVSIKTGTSAVAMQLQLEATDYPAYRVMLIDPARNETLWRGGSQKPRTKGERKALSVGFPAALLKSQNYILRVSGILSTGGSEIVGDYPFKVLK